MHPLAKAALGAVAAAYANEVVVKPARIAKLARAYATRQQKPMLTFVPSPGLTLKSIVTPSLALGDVNLHPESRGLAHGPGHIGRGSPYRIPHAPRTFGSVFSWDVLEHLERPDLALLEWHRVADRVFVVVPAWWTPEAWLNRWYIDPELKRAMPVWISQNRTIWLPSGPRRVYDAGTCRTPQQSPSETTPQTMTSTRQPSLQPPDRAEPGPASNESTASPLPIVNLSLLSPMSTAPTSEPQDYTPEGERSTSPSPTSDLPYLPPIMGSPSSTSVSQMMIISGPDPEND